MGNTYWTVRETDENGGTIRPMAGMWPDDSYGERDAKAFAEKKGMVAIQVSIIII